MGWYSGNYMNYEKAITEARESYRRLLHAEFGGDSHVGRHVENPLGGDAFTVPDAWDKDFKKAKLSKIAIQGDWSESYIVDLFDWHLGVAERLDWFVGNAQWAFRDFATPLRPENPIPYVNQKGLLDRAGNPKDAYYVFKSYWTANPKFWYLVSHTWTVRSGPRGLERPVRVYSNCEEVELLVGGMSQGKRLRDAGDFPGSGLRWQVMFAEGDNRLQAVGYEDGRPVTADSVNVHYTYTRHGEPQEIRLSVEYTPHGSHLITAVVVDKEGNRCLTYNKRIYFSHEGAGRLVRDLGSPTGSSVLEMASGKAQIEFFSSGTGRAVIEARTQDLKGNYLIFSKEGVK
jgi:beta-galactosidase